MIIPNLLLPPIVDVMEAFVRIASSTGYFINGHWMSRRITRSSG